MRTTGPKLAFNPFANPAVGDPWRSDEPDVKSVNKEAFDSIVSLVRQIHATPGLAALVLGEAGTGKTHLIKRLMDAREVEVIFVYVRPIRDHRRMASTLLQTVQANLEFPLPTRQADGEVTQLDQIVAHVITAAFEDYVRRHPDESGKRFLHRIKQDPLRIFRVRKSPQWMKLLSNTESFLKTKAKLVGEMPRLVLKVLFQYLDKPKRHAVCTFLSGFVPDKEDCDTLRLNLDTHALSPDAAEERSRTILQTIGKLLQFYRPMILCFDQLENLDTPELAQAFGTLITDIVNYTESVLPVVFIRHESWKSRFERKIEQAAEDRLTSNVIVLKGIDLDQALEIVKARLKWASEGVSEHRPDPFFPLDGEILEQKLKGVTRPRGVITLANTLLGAAPRVQDPLQVVQDAFMAEREKILASPKQPPAERATIVAGLELYFNNLSGRAAYSVRDLASLEGVDLQLQIVPKKDGEDPRLVQVIVETEAHWRPLQASLRRLQEGLEGRAADFAFFVRDARHKIPPKKGRMPATVATREAFEQAGGKVAYMDYTQLADLYALVYTANRIGSTELSYVATDSGTVRDVDEDVFRKFVRDEFNSEFLTAMENAFIGQPPVKPLGGRRITRENEQTIVKEIIAILAKPPFKYTLQVIRGKSKTIKLLDPSDDKVVAIISKQGSRILQIDCTPPIYSLKQGS